jgi:hypothetical protein
VIAVSYFLTCKSNCPHATRPLCSGFLKTIEVTAGMALPKNAAVSMET